MPIQFSTPMIPSRRGSTGPRLIMLVASVVLSLGLACLATGDEPPAPLSSSENTSTGAPHQFSSALLVPTWDHEHSAIGTNVDRIRSQATATPFANLMKQARVWQRTASGACATTYANYSGGVDANGYPTSNTGVCNWTDLFTKVTESDWPQGTYELRYAGSATINVTGPVTSGGANVANGGLVSVNQSTGPLKIEIDSGTPTDMRLYPPGGVCARNSSTPYDVQAQSFCSTSRCPGGVCPDAVTCSAPYSQCVEIADAAEAGELTFHPLWLSRLGQYRSIRFMDWNAVNKSQPPTFAGLTPESYFSYSYFRFSPSDVPPPVIAELCNLLSPIDCWINIPHTFPDAEAANLFAFYRDNTDPGVNLHFELSNETWNGGFNQGREMAAQAFDEDDAVFSGDLCCSGSVCAPPTEGSGNYAAMTSAGLSVGDYWFLTGSSGNCSAGTGSANTFCQFNGSTYDPPDIGECAAEYYGHRVINLSNLAEATFASEPVDRMRFIFARFAANTNTLRDSLDCTRRAAGNCADDMDNVDYYSHAAYFGVPGDCSVPGATTTDLCDAMASGFNTHFNPTTGTFRQAHDLYSSPPYSKSWPILAYEGGQDHFNMGFQVCVDIVVDPDSCIAETYVDAFDAYRSLAPALPVQTYMQFNHTGRFWVTTSDMGETVFGNNFGVRGSNFGAWPKESGILEWINTPSNDCWWEGCELPAPEPSFGLLLGSGACSLLAAGRRRRPERPPIAPRPLS